MLQLVIKKGIERLEFGSSLESVLGEFGQPRNRSTIGDVASHPHGRFVLHYDAVDIMLTLDLGVVSIDVDSTSPVELNGIAISKFDPNTLMALTTGLGFIAEIRDENDGDKIVESLEAGVIAVFVDKRLQSISIFNPDAFKRL